MRAIQHLNFKALFPVLLAGSLFLALFFSSLTWLVNSLHAPEYRLHSILLVGFVIFLLVQNVSVFKGFQTFEFRKMPFLVFLIGIIGFVVLNSVFQFDVLACAFLGISLYGFSGFILESKSWKKSSLVVLLFFACLPLSYHIETFLGFPLRILSAKLAGQFFSTVFGSDVQSVETILQIENKFAHVDLPCSGIKSLWSVTLFGLILSLMDRYKIGFMWVIALISSWVIVALANVVRIIALVFVYDSNLSEDMQSALHTPIGMCGFVIACSVSYTIFKVLCEKDLVTNQLKNYRFEIKSFCAICFCIALAIVGGHLTSAFLDAKTAASEMVPLANEGGLNALDLTSKERDLFLRHGVLQYQKKKFSAHGLSGTAFLVLSKSWRGHHHPEQCLQAQGALIQATHTLVISSGLPVRHVEIKDSPTELVYWFQAKDEVTEDFSSRVWVGFTNPKEAYVMVSLYLDKGITGDSSDFKNVIFDFYQQAHTMLENEIEKRNPAVKSLNTEDPTEMFKTQNTDKLKNAEKNEVKNEYQN